MTDGVHHADPRPVVALFCTRGMETFLSNAIQGILQTGIDASRIHVGCPNNAFKSVNGVARLHSVQIRVFTNQKLSEREARMEKYRSFGSTEFTDISWKKIFFVRQLLEHHAHVVYADLDVSWIRNPLPYLIEVALAFPMAFQTEGLPRFPPAVCCGFASFTKSERTVVFLNALIELYSSQLDSDNRLDDQAACQRLIENDVAWLHDIFFLPEALFPNGLGYRSLQNSGESPCPMEGELVPFLFHANWTVGLDNKHKLLADTGTWLIADDPRIDPAALAGGSPMEDAHHNQPLTEPRPLLTVIYPVYDVRGELVERIRLWTEHQDLDSRGYRIFVVAGTETSLDEAALRKVLRHRDAILRIPGSGRDADYWNAGAREANTPWLLFVEAHGLPERDSLSALTAWIAANPDSVACNFSIKNLKGDRIARFMKRWFADIQNSWASPSTWRRFHRTAFAIRRDIFEQAGPFEPKYGQFAPPLLSAHLHQRGLSISLIPTSSVIHEDSPDMSAHHADTADYARGEMDARAENDPVFFEKYFGPSPSAGPGTIRPARYSRSMLGGLVVAALHHPGDAFDLLRRARAFLPFAFISLRNRVSLLAAATRMDEWLVMRSSLAETLLWKRFLLAHHRVARAEQMLWIARNPPPALRVGPGNQRWPIATIGQHAIFGLHALEHLDKDFFRWTSPVFLLRLALTAKGVLTFETRNVRREIGLSDLAVVIAGRVLSSRDIALDDAGNIGISIRSQSAASGEIDIVVIAPELCEPANENGPGRRLGLPLFSVGFAQDSSGNHEGRPVNDADTKIPSRVVMLGERTRGPAEAIAAGRAGPKPDAIRL